MGSTEMKKIVRFGCIIITILILHVQLVYAHGVIYDTMSLDDNKIRITLKWSNPAGQKGIVISHFYLENGKTLHIGYETDDKAPLTAHLDYDLKSALPPVRVVLSKVNEVDYEPFKDIKGIEAEGFIRNLHDAGIVDGNIDGNFRPDHYLSRAEFAVILTHAKKLSTSAGSFKEFSDSKDHWAKKYILLAYKNGLMTGYKDGTFKPDHPITVAEVSAAISNSFTFKTVNNGIFGRLKAGQWYSKYVKNMFDLGILKTTDGMYKSFNEECNITRGNCAMMISRALSTF